MEPTTAMATKHNNAKNSAVVRVTAIAVALAAAGPVLSQPTATRPGQTPQNTQIGFSLGAGYSDNLLRTGSSAQSGNYSAPGFIVDLARESQRFRATAVGDLEYRDYSVSQIENEPFGQFAALVELRAVPERFSWFFTENYNQGRTDPFTPTGPNNREQISIFATGPSVILPVGERTSVRLGATAGQRTLDEIGDFDSDTVLASLGLYRQINTTTEIGIGGSSREVSYDINTAFDNTIDVVFGTYRKRFESGSASVDIGTNEVDFGLRSDSGTYFRADWQRGVGARSELSINVINQLVDAGDTFRGGSALEDDFITFDVYERFSGGVDLTVTRGNTEIEFGGRIGEDRYQNTTEFDNDVAVLSIDVERQANATMEYGLSLSFTKRDFKRRPQSDDDTNISLYLRRNFSRQLSLFATLIREMRGSGISNFDENSIRFSLQYDINVRGERDDT